ncbi:MAG: hypothetical protein JXA73_19455 [Acidobacteria bacterium]|nr:hypothetical protein [Acidobacteriota bacterium]
MRTKTTYATVVVLLVFGLIVTGCATQVPVAYPLGNLVTLVPPYASVPNHDPDGRISVQYAVIEIGKQVGLGYDWDTSFKNTDPACRTWIRPKIKNKSCHKALEKILKPVHLTYSVNYGKIVLHRR